MKNVITLFVLLLIHQVSFSQNIVTNGDFEEFSTCPPDASGPGNQMPLCTGWNTPTQANPDYFNACNQSTNSVGVPENGFGYQNAASGVAYAGIFTLEKPDIGWYREYISTSVAQMELGAGYRVSMKVSLANSSVYASDGWGILFYVDDIGVDTANQFCIPRTPQVDFSSYGIITDTENWITLVDTIFADSTYKKIVIGNFKDSQFVNKQHVQGNPMFGRAYYYIDDVVIEKISTGIDSHFLPESTLAPNPFTSSTTLTFKNPQYKKHTLSIYNIQGSLIRKTGNLTTDEVRIERDDLHPGCYFYELKREDGAVSKGKLFVQ